MVLEEKKTLPVGTSLRQTQKASSFISTKLNLASQISSNNDRKYLVSVLGTRAKGEGVCVYGGDGGWGEHGLAFKDSERVSSSRQAMTFISRKC